MDNYITGSLAAQVAINTTRRFNCPACQRIASFSITNTNGKILYHCFSDSCNNSGAYGYTPSTEELKDYIAKMKEEQKKVFTIPTRITRGLITMEQMDYCRRTNQVPASQRCSMGYDIQEVRHVWFLRDNLPGTGSPIEGAVGRSLNNGWPKVQIYENSKTMPFICGNNPDRCVIVEDCASACSVNCTNDFTGIALLGTQLKEEYIPYLARFKSIKVALDPDARNTGLNIRNSLTYICKDVKVWNIPCDFKDMTEAQVRSYISEQIFARDG